MALVCHELRTPVNAIAGWGQLLQAGALGDLHVAEAAQRIVQCAQAQGRLIGDILDMARSAKGKLNLERRPVSLSTVVKGAIDTVELAAREKSIRLSVSLKCSQDIVLGDARRLRQVVLNLVTNALKFTPSGGEVFVLLDRDGERLRLRVRDTGAGITQDFLPHVFERFAQGQNGAHSGLGLGLALVRSLVEAHGGRVAAESDGEGSGATFTVMLPAG